MPGDTTGSDDEGLRPGELRVDLPDTPDAGLFFIGSIRTPWPDRAACPKRGDLDGPDCFLVLDPRWRRALDGLDEGSLLQVLYWMHQARRDLALQRPRGSGRLTGTFALRSPMRPNPIASSQVRLVGRRPDGLVVRGLDCLDGTPLIDIKPDHCPVLTPRGA